MPFCDAGQGSHFSNTGVGENDIDSSLRLDGLIESVKVGQFGNVSLNASHIAADGLHGLIKFLLTTARDEDIGAFPDEQLGRSQPNSRRAAGDDSHLSVQPVHSRYS